MPWLTRTAGGLGQIAPAPPAGAPSAPTAPAPPEASTPTAPTAPTAESAPTLSTRLPGPTMPPLSEHGKEWWANQRSQTWRPLIRALRILMEGETATAAKRPVAGGTVTTGQPVAKSGDYWEVLWLFEWPTDLIVQIVPGATVARVQAARAQLRSVLPPAQKLRAEKRARYTREIEYIDEQLAEIERNLEELVRYRQWIQSVINQFQRYLAWFARHEEKKAAKMKKVSQVMSAVSAAVAWIPVVGTLLSVAITAADVSMQLKQARKALAAAAEAGAKIEAGQIAITAMEAYETTAHILLETQQQLFVERENRVTMLELLEGAPSTAPKRLAPVLQANQALRSARPKTGRWVALAVLLGLAAAWWGRR